jgi:pimeloyl-ACP methyl ester carboxylesterase
VISLDQRGRGLSTKTAFSYSIEDHALDVIGLLDHLKINSIRICGHSFGGLVATYLAYHFPERFEQVVILDAAPKMNPNTPEMLKATLSRIDAHYKNFDAYLSTVKQAPFLTFWDDAMLEYYKADVATAADGTVEPRSNLADIAQIAYHVSQEPWDIYFTEMEQPSILINAVEDYTLSQPLLPDFLAKEAVGRMKQSQYKAVNGNHQTMLFGEPAKEVLQQIQTFLLKDTH